MFLPVWYTAGSTMKKGPKSALWRAEQQVAGHARPFAQHAAGHVGADADM